MNFERVVALLSGGRDPRAGVIVFERDDMRRAVTVEGDVNVEAFDTRALPEERITFQPPRYINSNAQHTLSFPFLLDSLFLFPHCAKIIRAVCPWYPALRPRPSRGRVITLPSDFVMLRSFSGDFDHGPQGFFVVG